MRIIDFTAADAEKAQNFRSHVPVYPKTGCIHLPFPGVRADRVMVAFTGTAPGSIGGGRYTGAASEPPVDHWVACVQAHARPVVIEVDTPPVFGTVSAAILAFASQPRPGIIRVLDSATYFVDGVRLDDRGAPCPADPDRPRSLTIAAIDGEIPVLTGTLAVFVRKGAIDLTFEGLWIAGRLEVAGSVALRFAHATLRPPRAVHHGDAATVVVARRDGGAAPQVELSHCLTGSLRLCEGSTLRVASSIVDGDGDAAIHGSASVRCHAATIRGDLRG